MDASPSASSKQARAPHHLRICQSSCCKRSLRHGYQILPGGYTATPEAVAVRAVEGGGWMSPPSLRAVSFKGVLTAQPFWLTHAPRKKKKKRRSVSVYVHSCGSFYDEPQRDSKRKKKGRDEGRRGVGDEPAAMVVSLVQSVARRKGFPASLYLSLSAARDQRRNGAGLERFRGRPASRSQRSSSRGALIKKKLILGASSVCSLGELSDSH